MTNSNLAQLKETVNIAKAFWFLAYQSKKNLTVKQVKILFSTIEYIFFSATKQSANSCGKRETVAYILEVEFGKRTSSRLI